ncbi:MAG TPA: NUDIX hydrolase [Nitrososphaera sp.]
MRVKLIESKKVYDGEVSMRLEKFSINGNVVDKEIVEHRPSVGIMAVQGDNIFLVSQYRRAANRTLLEIPAGKIEDGETPLRAAKREMDEEIGYSGTLRPFLKWYLAPGYDTELMYLFVAKNLRKIASRRKMDDDEDISVRKVKLATAARMCFSGEIIDAKSIAAILAYKSKPV